MLEPAPLWFKWIGTGGTREDSISSLRVARNYPLPIRASPTTLAILANQKSHFFILLTIFFQCKFQQIIYFILYLFFKIIILYYLFLWLSLSISVTLTHGEKKKQT